MPTYKLTLAYDGTDFAGWQKQEPPDPAAALPGEPTPAPITTRKLEPGLVAGTPGRVALRTVQAVVERAVREVVREPVMLQGASRTDAGVHARAQVAVFACGEGTQASKRQGAQGAEAVEGRATGGWPVGRGVDRLLRAVNSRLPEDVQVVRAEVVREGFDPIGDCIAKGYSYSFWAGMHRPLWERRYVWHTWAALDVGAMQHAAAAFVGVHDFAAFAAAGHGRMSTVREVYACEVREEGKGEGATERRSDEGPSISGSHAEAEPGRMIRLEISGNGFLYNMVRIIAGTLHEVGRGRIDGGAIAEIIASGERRRAGPTLPPQGLCLEWIRYREGR
ncbi:MAG TPA: tRNA pseudouridine synthase A [Phycisphaerales bacterium]|nr:tRNA pseudouridine synthase A [Phycisphaerales bacterium]